jgi:hypothetical protein
MHSVAVGNKSLTLPALVPSISSFETQLDPLPALQLQQTLREPISLVSAYDIRNVGKELIELCKEYKKTAVLLLDSGGYEHSHILRYASGRAPSWGFDDYKKVCALNIHDFAFSYDYFWCDDPYPNESASDFELRLLGEFFNEHNFVSPEQLIPVLHLQTRKGDRRLDEAQILNLVARIAFGLAKKICDQIESSNKSVALHVLGCGNLLSFAFMCVAGVRMADGLEWYRTFAADNFHLHHFQQEPLFESASDGTYNPTADLILSLDVPYRVKVATRNLMSFQTFMAGLTPRLLDRTVYELVAKNFGKRAGIALRAVET